MKLLREYIRSLLEVEFGKVLWSKDERNTEEEEQLRTAIVNHIYGDRGGGKKMTIRTYKTLVAAASDPRYNKTIMLYTGPAYRGVGVSADWMDKHMPRDWMSLAGYNPDSKVNVDIKYDPFHQDKGYYKGGSSGVDSWTKSFERAKSFATVAWKHDPDLYYGIVLKADAKSSQNWIDLDEIIIQHQGSSFVNFGEKEVLTAFSPIPVSEITIVKFAEGYEDSRDSRKSDSVLTK